MKPKKFHFFYYICTMKIDIKKTIVIYDDRGKDDDIYVNKILYSNDTHILCETSEGVTILISSVNGKVQHSEYPFYYAKNTEEKIADKQVIIGYLNKAYGFNSYDTLPIGSPVYDTPSGYVLKFKHSTKDIITEQSYYKHMLSKHVDFI